MVRWTGGWAEWAAAGTILAFVGVLTGAEYSSARTTTPSPTVTSLALAGAAQDSLGSEIFHGKGNCYTCHGPDAKGTVLAPDLTDTTWLHFKAQPTVADIEKLVSTGVPNPMKHPSPMPAMGGASLSKAELHAVAEYVYSLSHPASTKK